MNLRFPNASILRPAVAACLLMASAACSHLSFPLLHTKRDVSSVELETKPGMVGKRPSARTLGIDLKVTPDPVKLGESRELNVTMIVRNNGKKPVGLKFATTQTIEILLREEDTGKVVSQWSTDQTFLAMSRYVVINPKERVEYERPITTRELKAGKTYNLEAYFVGYDQELRASRPIIPQP